MTALRPLLLSLLRTFVAWAWALFIGWLLIVLPIFQPFEESLLGIAELALPVLVAVIGAAWYAFWRWVEPRLPDWLTRAVLGSAKAPVYNASTSNTTADEAARVAAQTIDRVSGPDHRAE